MNGSGDLKDMILGEKNPNFISDQRMEGNLAITPNPNNPASYGDGSLEVSGLLYTDALSSATPNTEINVLRPMNIQKIASNPTLPEATQLQIYASSNYGGRLITRNSDDKIVDINPLSNIGDIMVYDGIKDTSVRFPVGMPEESLFSDRSTNFSTFVMWKPTNLIYPSTSSNTDGYIRYLELQNLGTVSLTNSIQPISFGNILRVDSINTDYIINTSDVNILQLGTYELNLKLQVCITDPSYNGNLANFEIYVEQETISGFSPVIGTKTYGILFPYGNDVSIPKTSVTLRTILRITSVNTRLRFQVREYTTTTGLLVIQNKTSTLSIIKLIAGSSSTDTSQYLAVHGLNGSRPTLTTSFTTLPTNTIMFRTNVSDSVNSNSVTVNTAGQRRISGKFTFMTDNTDSNKNAKIQCRLSVNSIALPETQTECYLLTDSTGNEISVSVYINTEVYLAANDIVTIDAKILSTNITVGSITVISEECTLYISLLSSSLTTFSAERYDISQSVRLEQIGNSVSEYADLFFNVARTNTGQFNTYNDKSITEVITGGTYQILYQGTIYNIDTINANTILFRVLVNTNGDKFLPIENMYYYLTIAADSRQGMFFANTVYLPPHSLIKIQAIEVNGGNNLQILEDSNRFTIYKLENTNSSFIGSIDYGKLYSYVSDVNETQTTSTTYEERLSMTTAYLSAGNYKFSIYFEWDMSQSGSSFDTRVLLDNTTTIDTYSSIPISIGYYQKHVSFHKLALSSGEHIFVLETKSQQSDRAIKTKNIKMELFRIN